MDIEPDQKVERNFLHVTSRVDTENFKPLPVLGVLLQHEAVEEGEKVVDEEEDEKVVVHQLDTRGFMKVSKKLKLRLA